MEFRQSTLENMVMNLEFWKNKRVFLTGHTGFKGSWLALWLQSLGASVTGFSLEPEKHSMFTAAKVEQGITHIIGDIRDDKKLQEAMQAAKPDIVLHLAAQSLVRYSYQHPVATYATNVMGTVNVLEAARHTKSVRAVVNVTSDKCYENKEWARGYNESDQLGGYDPYSNSKGCSELVTSAYRRSFFTTAQSALIASARAGNVIGGGDWAVERLVPDVIKAWQRNESLILRYPNATRPWQHVLNPLSGYLLLAEKLYSGDTSFADAWNFGPEEQESCTVDSIVERLQKLLGARIDTQLHSATQPHEAHYLKLDCSKAKTKLRWIPVWDLNKGLNATADWYLADQQHQDMRNFTLKQIHDFTSGLTTTNICMEIQ